MGTCIYTTVQDFHNRNKWLQSLSNFFFSVGDRFERAFKLNIHPYLNFVEGHQMKLAHTVQYVGYQRKWMNTGTLLTRVRTHAPNIDKTNSACASANRVNNDKVTIYRYSHLRASKY